MTIAVHPLKGGEAYHVLMVREISLQCQAEVTLRIVERSSPQATGILHSWEIYRGYETFNTASAMFAEVVELLKTPIFLKWYAIPCLKCVTVVVSNQDEDIQAALVSCGFYVNHQFQTTTIYEYDISRAK